MKTPSPISIRSGRRWIAGALAALLALGGSILTAAPALAEDGPSVSVTEAPREGGAITVTGSGFTADTTGIYIGVGPASASGFYSAGIDESGTVWVATGLASTVTRAPMAADGSFELQLQVPAIGDAELAVFTSRAHGGGMMGDLSQDTATTVVYATPIEEPGTEEPGTEEPGTGEPGTEEPGTEEPGTEEPGTEEPTDSAPVLTLSKSVDLLAEGETVTVTGKNYNAAQAMYLTLCTDVPLEQVSFAFISAGCTTGAKLISPNPRTPSMVKLEADGSFTTQFTVTSKGASTAVYTIADHTAMLDRSQDAKVTVTFAKPKPEEANPFITVSPATEVDASVDNSFTIAGTGFVGDGAAFGAYVLIGDAGIWAGDGPLVSEGWLAQAWVRPALIVDGAFTTTIAVPKGRFDPSKQYVVATSAAHGFSVSDRSLDSFASITLVKGSTTPTTPTVPTDPVPGTTPTIASGSLSWGVSTAFREYIVGNTAKGSITVGSGATQSGGLFQFGQTGGSYSPMLGTGTADYAGSVRFSGHGGLLDLTFANPTLRVTTPTSGVLEVSVNRSRVDLANVDLSRGSKSLENGATRIANAPVTLTAAGASAFEGYYSAGTALDPLTVVIGTPGAAPAGNSGTVASTSAAKAAPRSVPATPPATTGITLDPATLAALAAGKEVTVAVDGFQPNEAGIMVVVYSTPTVLARDLVADAAGVVTWTGSLPAGLAAGDHTLTFQGSTAKGIRFTVSAPAGLCTVTEATLDWGFKASFLQYLEGGIANGEWIVTGASERDGVFGFTGGSGSIEAETVRGIVAFPGSIEFTGHDGALDTTIANPSIEFVSSDEAYLRLDVTGTTQQGAPVTATAVRFAALDLEGALERDGDSLIGTAVPAEFTEEGAAAFGTYASGEELDPVAFAITLPADCGIEAEASKPDVQPAAAVDSEVQTTAAEGPAAWLIWLLVAVVVLAIAALVVFLILRSRRAAR